MPFIHFINVNEEIVQEFSNTKIDAFKQISNADIKNINVIYHNTKIVNHPGNVYIKIEWMPRPKEMEEAVVNLINEFMKQHDYNQPSIHFTIVDKEHYYAGGK